MEQKCGVSSMELRESKNVDYLRVPKNQIAVENGGQMIVLNRLEKRSKQSKSYRVSSGIFRKAVQNGLDISQCKQRHTCLSMVA